MFLAAGVAAAGTPLFGQGSPVLGAWNTTANTPMGELKSTITFSRTGDAYAVDIKDQPMAAGAGAPPADATPPPTTLSDVKVDGSTFSFKRTIESPQGTIALDYSGSVDGDALTAKAHSDFGDVDITGTRAQ
ncbi:MAG TPA: hypothetical protein VF418_07510 [Sphingomonadaceae bacterium]